MNNRMKRLLKNAPTDISNHIYRMMHEIGLSDVIEEFTNYNWYHHRLRTTIQSYAIDGLTMNLRKNKQGFLLDEEPRHPSS